jgi:hypothetical protein
MGIENSKHINFLDVHDTLPNPEFIIQRKAHCKNEFTYAKNFFDEEDYDSLCITEREPARHIKRTTFLEPKDNPDKISKDFFRKRSVLTEFHEFTYAKKKFEKKKAHEDRKSDGSMSSDQDKPKSS